MENIEVEVVGQQMGEGSQYMTLFFVFDSMVEKVDVETQMAFQLFKKIQKETLT
ncbi:MAG: hypothetical protein ACQESD_06740 [Thermoplasmatota archaeon]